MTDKELHRLRRRDLLELLIMQGKENLQLREQADRLTTELTKQQETCTRLIERLNEKDTQIEKLKGRLDEKDARLGRLKELLEQRDGQIGNFEEAESIAEVAAKLNTVFEAAQKAVEQYLHNTRKQTSDVTDIAE